MRDQTEGIHVKGINQRNKRYLSLKKIEALKTSSEKAQGGNFASSQRVIMRIWSEQDHSRGKCDVWKHRGWAGNLGLGKKGEPLSACEKNSRRDL